MGAVAGSCQHLSEPEQIEVVDHEGAGEHRGPTEQVQTVERCTGPTGLDRSDRLGHRLPLLQQHEHQARGKHEGGALDRGRDDPREPGVSSGPAQQDALVDHYVHKTPRTSERIVTVPRGISDGQRR